MRTTQAFIYEGTPQEASIWRQDEKQCIVVQHRRIARGVLKREEIHFVDYCPDKKKWLTQLRTIRDEVTGWRACDKAWLAAVAEIKNSGLYEHNYGRMCNTWYHESPQ